MKLFFKTLIAEARKTSLFVICIFIIALFLIRVDFKAEKIQSQIAMLEGLIIGWMIFTLISTLFSIFGKNKLTSGSE